MDLEHNCVWDEEHGVMIDEEGMKKLMNLVADQAATMWQFNDFHSAEHDGSLFLLYFSRKYEEKKPKQDCV